ncbi:phage minor head protein [Streptomyces sp. NPDC052299]|uniref:phage minor head protein n=1 Tax=Streptomyces sp. NPDC052299 TaxID=3155054 RepID=UPI003443D3C7
MGPVREQQIARTEAAKVWNTATLAAAQAAAGPDRPVVKQWITRHDARVRTAHAEANGQMQLLAEPFTVGGIAMQTPGDPTAPAGLVINCRCRLAVRPRTARDGPRISGGPRSGNFRCKGEPCGCRPDRCQRP